MISSIFGFKCKISDHFVIWTYQFQFRSAHLLLARIFICVSSNLCRMGDKQINTKSKYWKMSSFVCRSFVHRTQKKMVIYAFLMEKRPSHTKVSRCMWDCSVSIKNNWKCDNTYKGDIRLTVLYSDTAQ